MCDMLSHPEQQEVRPDVQQSSVGLRHSNPLGYIPVESTATVTITTKTTTAITTTRINRVSVLSVPVIGLEEGQAQCYNGPWCSDMSVDIAALLWTE